MKMKFNKQTRYQDCSLMEKTWRRRYYVLIPFETIYIYIFNIGELTLKESYGLSKGLAQLRMNWMHSWEEVKARLGI